MAWYPMVLLLKLKKVGTTVGADYVNLTSVLTPDYLTAIPVDPDGGSAADTGYLAYIDSENRAYVMAPNAELGQSITSGGNSNLALRFDGVDDSVVYGSTNTSTPTAISVEAWISQSSVAAVNSVTNIGTQSATVGFNWLYIANGTSMRWQYANGTTVSTLTTNYTFNANQWYHIAVTHDYVAKQVKMYVNGVLVNTFNHADTALPISSKPIYVGRYSGSSYPFAGTMDEFQLYNRVLTPTEIADHASREQSTTTTGLLAGYHFDEPTGTAANDYSPNGRNAVITGALHVAR